MTRLAVFDLDGTLVDSAPDLHSALDRMVAALGKPGFRRAEVLAMIGDGVRVLVTRALAARGLPFEQGALDRFMADYEAQPVVETRPFPGIEAALDRLAAEGWRLAVCTNKPELAARRLLDALGLAGRFAAVCGGDSAPVRKPDPGHLRATIEAAGGADRGVAMVGDHHNDIAAARGAGVPALFVGWGYGTLAMAEGAPVVTRAEDLPGELGALLDRLRA
jgi:phosphoglycolate phosphatase